MRQGDKIALGAALAAFLLLWSRDAKAVEDSRFAGLISEGDSSFQVDVTGMTWGTADQGDTMAKVMSSEGYVALSKREGFSPTSYPDYKGRSIGYGHLIKLGEEFTEPMSQDQALDLLEKDVAWAEGAVNSAVHVPLTQNQFDALVSFCFNVGLRAFMNSTLVKKLNADDPTAADEFSKWVYVTENGEKVVHDGLVARREGEANQFLA